MKIALTVFIVFFILFFCLTIFLLWKNKKNNSKYKQKIKEKEEQINKLNENFETQIEKTKILKYKQEITKLIEVEINKNLKNESSFSNSLNNVITDSLKNKLDLIKNLFDEINNTNKNKIDSIKNISEDNKKIFKSVETNIKNFNNLFLKNINTIGELGENILDWILKGLNTNQKKIYFSQYKINENKEYIVDAYLKFNNKNIAIDSKFNVELFTNIQNSISKGNIDEKEKHEKKLKDEIIKNIKDINKKYVKINIKHNVSFGILFIPSDAIFIYAIEKWNHELLKVSNEENVIIASPIILYFITTLLKKFDFKINFNENILKLSNEIKNFWIEVKNTIESFENFKTKQKNFFKAIQKLDFNFQKLNDQNIDDKIEMLLKDKNNKFISKQENKKNK